MPIADDALAVVGEYVLAWSVPDIGEAERHLRACWGDDSEIIGPGYHFRGIDAVLDEICRFRRQQPGWSVATTSGFDGHGRWVRVGIALVDPGGAQRHEGWSVVELGAGGRIARVITFWGTLPPLPPSI